MILTVAIYNGFSTYHELYSYILYWCKRNNFECTIYSNECPDHYKEKFPFLTYEKYSSFINNAHLYHIVFLTTADEYTFSKSWLDLFGLRQKIIKFNHGTYDRHPEIQKCINVKKLDNYGQKFIYSLNDKQDKEDAYQALYKYIRDNRPKLFTQITDNLIMPRNLFFMWLAKPGNNTSQKNSIPCKYSKNIKTFRKHNPDYNIKIWNLEETSEAIEKHLPEFYYTFLSMTPWISKCDFARFCLIYIFGGVYSDLDFYCNKNLDGLLEGKEYIFTFEPREHGGEFLYNGFFASVAKNPFIYGWLKTMEDNFMMRDVMHRTGPSAFSLYYSQLEHKPQITETYKIILYNKLHLVTRDIGDLENVDNNSVYTLWDEGTDWYSERVIQYICIGIILIIMILIFAIYLILR